MKNDKKPHIKQDTSKYRENHSQDKYGVIGVCGVVGNMVTRVLVDNGLKVRGTDILGENECTFQYTLHDYPIQLFLGGHPESFFQNLDYIIPPPSLSKNSNFYKNLSELAKEFRFKIKSVDDVLTMITPHKPVLCITGTNGKTTTTSLLKHICSQAGLKPTEHGFNELQGNIEYIPPLQCRLEGDVSVLETGTFGNPGDLKFIMERCQPSCGIITNITPDHLNEDQNFLNYAHIKGEMVEHLQDKMLIINSDDPTVMGLINDKDVLDLITFGVDYKTGTISKKTCFCRREVTLNETISGMGYYKCSCGLERPNPDYLATEITKKSFKLHTPNEVRKVEMQLMGLHNVYNALAAIAAAKEFFKIPLDDIITAVKNFRGVPGRMDYIGRWDDKKVLIDYAHNPGGVETILGELKKIYESIAVVITVSSESGEEGDDVILKKSLKLADYIIPASFYARKAADKFIESAKGSDEKILLSEKIILTSEYPHEFKKGTLGANSDQLIKGLLKAIQYDVSAVVCIGEAAFKYKENIHTIINRKRQS